MSRFFLDRPVFAWVIAIAMMLAGGLDGIQHETPAPEAAEENLHEPPLRHENRLNTLPDSLAFVDGNLYQIQVRSVDVAGNVGEPTH